MAVKMMSMYITSVKTHNKAVKNNNTHLNSQLPGQQGFAVYKND